MRLSSLRAIIPVLVLGLIGLVLIWNAPTPTAARLPDARQAYPPANEWPTFPPATATPRPTARPGTVPPPPICPVNVTSVVPPAVPAPVPYRFSEPRMILPSNNTEVRISGWTSDGNLLLHRAIDFGHFITSRLDVATLQETTVYTETGVAGGALPMRNGTAFANVASVGGPMTLTSYQEATHTTSRQIDSALSSASVSGSFSGTTGYVLMDNDQTIGRFAVTDTPPRLLRLPVRLPEQVAISPAQVRQLSISPDERFAVTFMERDTLLINLQTHAVCRIPLDDGEQPADKDDVRTTLDLSWRNDGKQVALNTGVGEYGEVSGDQIMLLDLDTLHLTQYQSPSPGPIKIAWSPDNVHLLVMRRASDNGPERLLSLLDTRTGQEDIVLIPQTYAIIDIAFTGSQSHSSSYDAKMIATVCYTKTETDMVNAGICLIDVTVD